MHRGLGDDSRIHKINEEYLNANASTISTATGYTNTVLYSWIFGKKACATIIHWRKQISHHTLQNFASCLVFSIKSSKASRALVGFPKCREMDYLSYSREICLWPCPNKEAKIKTFSQHQPILIQNLEVGQPSKQWSDGTHLSPPISR